MCSLPVATTPSALRRPTLVTPPPAAVGTLVNNPSYNVAPSQQVAAVRAAEGGRELALLHWGLAPPSADTLAATLADAAGAKVVNSDPRETRNAGKNRLNLAVRLLT